MQLPWPNMAYTSLVTLLGLSSISLFWLSLDFTFAKHEEPSLKSVSLQFHCAQRNQKRQEVMPLGKHLGCLRAQRLGVGYERSSGGQ